MWWHGSWGWWQWLGMSVAMLAFWTVVVWAVVALLRGGEAAPAARQSPEAILAERFAAGEIDEDEYRRRREVLRADRRRTPSEREATGRA